MQKTVAKKFNILPSISVPFKLLKNGDFESLKASGGSAVAYAWFVWVKGYKGSTQLAWI